MKVGIIQNKIDFKCTYDERERVFNIQIPDRKIFENLFNKTHSEIVDVYLEIAEVEPKESEDKE